MNMRVIIAGYNGEHEGSNGVSWEYKTNKEVHPFLGSVGLFPLTTTAEKLFFFLKHHDEWRGKW